ncbi:HPr family phosphocarrier protein [Marinimicrobium agarilyticum]|uniref:HPr family phosphocarrier protein n=1 Tax=Marinimicrobium agarilyticum TaxID=306546 RepID=UPI00042A61CB|nr:HPr family phosphocarrier protein [Marinimicrobium agarilyticum]
MPSKTITLINKKGLHARAAAKLATIAGQYQCQIQVRCLGGDTWVDGKSVMSLMLLAAACGTELELCAEGEDAPDALVAIGDLINDRFEEGE